MRDQSKTMVPDHPFSPVPLGAKDKFNLFEDLLRIVMAMEAATEMGPAIA
jgi:hypothetical protein